MKKKKTNTKKDEKKKENVYYCCQKTLSSPALQSTQRYNCRFVRKVKFDPLQIQAVCLRVRQGKVTTNPRSTVVKTRMDWGNYLLKPGTGDLWAEVRDGETVRGVL